MRYIIIFSLCLFFCTLLPDSSYAQSQNMRDVTKQEALAIAKSQFVEKDWNSGKSPWLTNQAEVKPTRPRATQIAFKTEGCLPWTKTNCAWIYSMLGLYQSK